MTLMPISKLRLVDFSPFCSSSKNNKYKVYFIALSVVAAGLKVFPSKKSSLVSRVSLSDDRFNALHDKSKLLSK